ncbi:MAG: hypothetical protein QM743_00780 [Chitinophagaceae bacterium]
MKLPTKKEIPKDKGFASNNMNSRYRNTLFFLLFTCACLSVGAQVNFVLNPSFEDTVNCPSEWGQIRHAKYWSCAVDTTGETMYTPEYNNTCSPSSGHFAKMPDNIYFYQYPHTGNGTVSGHLYYDRTSPFPPFLDTTYRDYFQGHLVRPLEHGKQYCVAFWVNMAEIAGYAHDHIGVYLDDGSINKRSKAGIEITDVIPQFYTTAIIKDTQNWVKAEGSFIATGNETHITLGNFAKQADVDTNYIYLGTCLPIFLLSF